MKAVNTQPVSEQHTGPRELIRTKPRKTRTSLSTDDTDFSTLRNLEGEQIESQPFTLV